MHFAYPARKSSPPHLYTSRGNSKPFAVLRRNGRVQSIGIIAVGVIGLIWLVYHILATSGSSEGRRSYAARNAPKAVIVTVFDDSTSEAHREAIRENRQDYAARHGYTTFFRNTSSYHLDAGTPKSWLIIPSLRHAMTLYPHTPYLFYLSPTALIMAPQLSLESHLLTPTRLEAIMLPNKPVVPPDSVIKTFAHIKGSNVDLVLTQDSKGLSPHSMVLRSGEWAKFLLDAWFDPLYRTYNFQKAERHALEHIAQWHGTILARLALVPQRLMNSYTPDARAPAKEREGGYSDGDFVANHPECAHRRIDGGKDGDVGEDDKDDEQAPDKKGKAKKAKKVFGNECEKEMAPMLGRWREMVDREKRRGRS